jgi:four helix bundle protein
MGEIVSFRDLEVWRMAHRLVLMVYQVTGNFPVDERFGLISQMRRAAVSVPSNIVEGFRRQGVQDKIRHYNIAEGSLEELKYFFILAADLNYATTDTLMAQAEVVGRLLHGFIESTQRRRK